MADLLTLASFTGNLEVVKEVMSRMVLTQASQINIASAMSAAVICEYTDIALYLMDYVSADSDFLDTATLDRFKQYTEKALSVKKDMTDIVELVNSYSREFEDEDESLSGSESESDTGGRPVVRNVKKRGTAPPKKGTPAKKASQRTPFKVQLGSDSDDDIENPRHVIDIIKEDMNSETV